MPSIMIQGTSSGAGKTTLVTALCRALADRSYHVAPFKAQNMSRFTFASGSFVVSRAQAIQATAARCPVSHHINPIVLVPQGDNISEVYVHGESLGTMNASEYYAYAATDGIRQAAYSLRTLLKKYEVVVIEGAGSPAEINVPFDIANMRMAEVAGSPVVIVSDIERGGCFAQMAGTIALLEERHRRMVRGFVINKFRGDPDMLEAGIRYIDDIYGVPTISVLPYIDTRLPAEDSLDMNKGYAKPDTWDGAVSHATDALKKHLDIDALLRMISS